MGKFESAVPVPLAAPEGGTPEVRIRPEVREEPSKTERERLRRAQEELEMLQRDAGKPAAGPRRRMAALKRLTGREVEDAAELDRAYAEEIVRMTAQVRSLDRSPFTHVREMLLVDFLPAEAYAELQEGRLESRVETAAKDADWLRGVDIERTYHDDAYYRAMFGNESGFTHRSREGERFQRKESTAETKHEFIDRVVTEREERLRHTQDAMHALGIVRGHDGLLWLHPVDRPQDRGELIDATLAHALVTAYDAAEQSIHPEERAHAHEQMQAARARVQERARLLFTVRPGYVPELNITPAGLAHESEAREEEHAQDPEESGERARRARRASYLRVVPDDEVRTTGDDFEIIEDVPAASELSEGVVRGRAHVDTPPPPDIELGLQVFGILDRAKAEGWTGDRAERLVDVAMRTAGRLFKIPQERIGELRAIAADELERLWRADAAANRGAGPHEMAPTPKPSADFDISEDETGVQAFQEAEGNEKELEAGFRSRAESGEEVERASIGPEVVRTARDAYAAEQKKPSKWGWIAERAKGVVTGGFTEFWHFFGYGHTARKGAKEIEASLSALRADAGITPEAKAARIERIVDEAEFKVMQRLMHYKDQSGDWVLDVERLDGFTGQLRRKLKVLHEQQEDAERGEFRDLILKSFDPAWWRRGVYGVMELALASKGIQLLIDHAFSSPLPRRIFRPRVPNPLVEPSGTTQGMHRTVWDTMRQMFPGANDHQLTDVVRRVMEHNGIVDPTPGSTGFTHANGLPNQWAGDHLHRLVESGRNWIDATKMPEGFPLRIPQEVAKLIGSL
ncbi:hypothetical protein HY632_02180 [Candidatus Uhrbacteria bacterium]|nr:hypothetical protein [Candidatus Uhrbacteria bacterium]